MEGEFNPWVAGTFHQIIGVVNGVYTQNRIVGEMAIFHQLTPLPRHDSEHDQG
jgi:hypothetical protein